MFTDHGRRQAQFLGCRSKRATISDADQNRHARQSIHNYKPAVYRQGYRLLVVVTTALMRTASAGSKSCCGMNTGCNKIVRSLSSSTLPDPGTRGATK